MAALSQRRPELAPNSRAHGSSLDELKARAAAAGWMSCRMHKLCQLQLVASDGCSWRCQRLQLRSQTEALGCGDFVGQQFSKAAAGDSNAVVNSWCSQQLPAGVVSSCQLLVFTLTAGRTFAIRYTYHSCCNCE